VISLWHLIGQNLMQQFPKRSAARQLQGETFEARTELPGWNVLQRRVCGCHSQQLRSRKRIAVTSLYDGWYALAMLAAIRRAFIYGRPGEVNGEVNSFIFADY